MFCEADATQLWEANTSKVVIVDVGDSLPCRIRLTGPMMLYGVWLMR